MSDVVAQAVTALNEKLGGAGIDGTAKFNIEGEGSMMVDSAGARIGDEDADVTFNADVDTLREMFDGDLDPTSAFMSGRLSIDGDMGLAMKLAATLWQDLRQQNKVVGDSSALIGEGRILYSPGQIEPEGKVSG